MEKVDNSEEKIAKNLLTTLRDLFLTALVFSPLPKEWVNRIGMALAAEDYVHATRQKMYYDDAGKKNEGEGEGEGEDPDQTPAAERDVQYGRLNALGGPAQNAGVPVNHNVRKQRLGAQSLRQSRVPPFSRVRAVGSR